MSERYRNSVVTFLDILGFREIIKTSDASAVSEMLDAIGETAASPVGVDGDLTHVISFSDSVIRARPTGKEPAYDALLHEIQDLAASQWSLMEFGILVRGGITIGDVATSEGRAFGPAFVRAYDLESSLASSPRIIVDPIVIEHIREHVGNVSGKAQKRSIIEELKRHIRLGGDGLWFVDYLASVSITMGDPQEVESAMLRFKDSIVAKANALHTDSLVLPKLLWLIRYHNTSAKRLFPSNSILRIKNSDVPLSDELLKPVLLKRPLRL